MTTVVVVVVVVVFFFAFGGTFVLAGPTLITRGSER